MVAPAPDPGSHPGGSRCPLVSLTLPELGGPVRFPEVELLPGNPSLELGQLDRNSQQQLRDYCEQDILSFHRRPTQDKEVLWEKRDYLVGVAGALPKVVHKL